MALIGVFLADLVAPKSVEAIPVALILVIAAAWLLSAPLALAIALLAVSLLAAEVIVREVHPVTAAVEAAVFVVLAAAARFYSTRLRSLLRGNDGDRRSLAASVFGLENLAQLVEGSGEGVAAIDREGRIRYANAAATELLRLGEGSAPGQGLLEHVVAEDRERVRAEFGSPAQEPPAHLKFGVRNVDGSVRQVQTSHTPVVVRRRPLSALVLRDVSEVNRLQQAASALAETAASLAVTQSLERTLNAIAQRVVEVTQACACGVFLLERERSLRMAGSWGLPQGYETAANRALKAGANPPILEAIRTGVPVFVENLPERIRTESQFAGMRTVVREVAWRLAIALPMLHAGQPLGGLAAYFLPGQRPDEPTMDFLSTIAGQAASAAEISRLVTAGQREVVAKERLHLSRELHDSLSQRLYGIILGTRSIEMRLDGNAEAVAEPLAYVLDLAQGGLAEMRDIVHQLRPDSLEKEGLIAALNRHADAMSARHQLEVFKILPTEPAVSLDTKLAAYRIAVEALSNVSKHANAKHAWLRVEQEDGRLAIEVRDDGDGFDAAESFPGHFGLATMRERAGAHGGELKLESYPGLGTSVRTWLPAADAVKT